MKKKIAKKKKPSKQKIDVVLESLLNLEQKMKELIDGVKDLYTQRYYHPYNAEPKKYCPYVVDNTKWNPPEYN